MSAMYTPANAAAGRDLVRLLIPDKDLTGLTPVGGVYTLTTYTYADAELDAFLSIEYGSEYRAAALALETLASAMSSSGSKISGLGYSIDETAGAASMLERAKALRAQASSGSGVPTIGSLTAGALWPVR